MDLHLQVEACRRTCQHVLLPSPSVVFLPVWFSLPGFDGGVLLVFVGPVYVPAACPTSIIDVTGHFLVFSLVS